jgi:hypothetical protein
MFARQCTTLAAGLALCSIAAAQGSDLCANAQIINGTGTFPFDNTAATKDGGPDPLCMSGGQDDIDADVWFSWIAPNDGVFALDTCGQTTVDTKVGVYDGSCSGTVLACNDDACAVQSEISWVGVAGQIYIFRIGVYPGALGGTGTFTVSENVPQQNPDNGHYYFVVDQGGLGWDLAKQAAEQMSFMGTPGHLATLTDQAENDFVYSLGGLQWHWIGGFQNTNSPSYSEPAGGWEWVTGEPWSFENWHPGEPNDTGASGAEDYLELLTAAAGYSDGWNDAAPQEHPAGYVVEYDVGQATAYCFGDGTGAACPCGNNGGPGEGCANSSGSGATVASTGSTSVAADDLGFNAQNLLPGQGTLLFVANNALAGQVFGDGLRCAGGGLIRLGVKMPDGSGSASWGPGLGVKGGWVAGDIRRFQVWYRDPGMSPCATEFNTSHGLELLFQP